jgi:tRNA/tmRNA/rRNA uracil-C5-methylase (TrmA/RlmC/RlmD family)
VPSSDFLPLLYLQISGTLVTLVLKASRSERIVEWARESSLKERLCAAGATGLFLNFNPSAGERVLSQRGWLHVWGEEMARDSDGFWYGPDSFRQLLPSLHRRALLEAANFLNPGRGDTVVDLYSGSGASLRIWKERGASLMGVELGGEAIRCCERNVGAKVVFRGRASERVPQLSEWVSSLSGRRLLFANPPRIGMEDRVTRWIGTEYRPQRIAYLSCSAGTLARDLSILKNSGYALRKATPYDFFPGTHHVETLALVERTA